MSSPSSTGSTKASASRRQLLSMVSSGAMSLVEAAEVCSTNRALGRLQLLAAVRSLPGIGDAEADEMLWVAGADRKMPLHATPETVLRLLEDLADDPWQHTGSPPGWPFWAT